MDFSLGLAQGFHNAPKLYGDDVRPAQKITGFGSGLKAAGKGLSLGLYDGISGLVMQPIKGAKEDGPTGLIKGFGKGIGGVVLKGGAGTLCHFHPLNDEIHLLIRPDRHLGGSGIHTEGYSQRDPETAGLRCRQAYPKLKNGFL